MKALQNYANLEQNIKSFLESNYKNGVEIYVDYRDEISKDTLANLVAQSSNYDEFLLNTQNYVLDLYYQDDFYIRDNFYNEIMNELEEIYDECDFDFNDLYEEFSDLIDEYYYLSIDTNEVQKLLKNSTNVDLEALFYGEVIELINLANECKSYNSESYYYNCDLDELTKIVIKNSKNAYEYFETLIYEEREHDDLVDTILCYSQEYINELSIAECIKLLALEIEQISAYSDDYERYSVFYHQFKDVKNEEDMQIFSQAFEQIIAKQELLDEMKETFKEKCFSIYEDLKFLNKNIDLYYELSSKEQDRLSNFSFLNKILSNSKIS